MTLKLDLRELSVDGRVGYFAVSGVTRKTAERIIEFINQGVNEFCKVNRLAGLLCDLEAVRFALERITTSEDEDGWYFEDVERAAAGRIVKWIDAHKDTGEQQVIAYLSLDQERYADQALGRKAGWDSSQESWESWKAKQEKLNG